MCTVALHKWGCPLPHYSNAKQLPEAVIRSSTVVRAGMPLVAVASRPNDPARLVSKGDKSMESRHLFMAWVSGMLCCGAKCAVAGARAAMVAAVSCRARAGLAIQC